MTKKDYRAIAEVLRQIREDAPDDTSYYDGVLAVESALARMLARDNPRFDADRFYVATGKIKLS